MNVAFFQWFINEIPTFLLTPPISYFAGIALIIAVVHLIRALMNF